MTESVYIETSIFSYLTARPSNDLRAMANQGITLEWWAEADAYHVAIAAVNGVNFLLTWNCTHIANAHTRPKIETICRELGYDPPVICTPFELMEM